MNKSWWVVLAVVIVLVSGFGYFVGNGPDLNVGGGDSGGSLPSVGEPQLYPASEDLGGFCGLSTRGECEVDGDCVIGGCSGQVCQSVNEEQVLTTCEVLDCYDKDVYTVSCGCVSSKCEWATDQVF